MATTFSKITNIVEYLKQLDDGKITMPISEIDGIGCTATIDCSSFIKKNIRFQIRSDYKDYILFHKMFDEEATHEDIVAFIKTIRNLKYCKTTTELCFDPAEDRSYHERKFLEELLTAPSGEASSCKTSYGECPVCLDTCYTVLSCRHHLCLKCESKLTKKTCPQCRDEYIRFEDEGDY
jgi:hypothetical protein